MGEQYIFRTLPKYESTNQKNLTYPFRPIAINAEKAVCCVELCCAKGVKKKLKNTNAL